MATFQRRRDDILVTCPYNEAHRVKESRLQLHLIKCRKNNPNSRLVLCQFNASHVIEPELLMQHLANCPNRVILDKSLCMNDKFEKYKGCTEVPRYNLSSLVTEESWEDETEQESPYSHSPLPMPGSTAKNRGIKANWHSPKPSEVSTNLEESSNSCPTGFRKPKNNYRELMNNSRNGFIASIGTGILSPLSVQTRFPLIQETSSSLIHGAGRAQISLMTPSSVKSVSSSGRGIIMM